MQFSLGQGRFEGTWGRSGQLQAGDAQEKGEEAEGVAGLQLREEFGGHLLGGCHGRAERRAGMPSTAGDALSDRWPVFLFFFFYSPKALDKFLQSLLFPLAPPAR